MPRRNRGPHLHWRPDRSVWEIRWFERGCRRARSTGTDNRRDAEAQLAQALLEAEPDGPRDPSQRWIADVLTAYVREHGQTVRSADTLAAVIKALIPYWGGLTVSEITEHTVRAYCRQRVNTVTGAPVSDGTKRNDIIFLAAAVRHDWREGRITRTVHIPMPPPSRSRDRWLTRSEAAHLLRAARRVRRSRPHLTLFILLALYTAGRHEAILSLRWPQVDLDRGQIDLRDLSRPDTTKGRARIPIPWRLTTFLRYARRRGSATGYVVNYDGRPLTNIEKSFKRAAREAGLQDVTPHTLRHTAATWMVQAGVPWWQIARYLGHTTTLQVEMTYGHHRTEWLAEAAGALDRRQR